MILGFYSERAALQVGYSIWTTVRGNQVFVTEACRTPEAVERRPRWPDEVERGEIVACVKANDRESAFLSVSIVQREHPRPSYGFTRTEHDDGA